MTAGIQELLLLVVIALAIFFLPRMASVNKRSTRPAKIKLVQWPNLSGRQRLAIVVSFFWPAALAIYLAPWQTGWKTYLMLGVGPVILLWGLVWVFAGFKNRKTKY